MTWSFIPSAQELQTAPPSVTSSTIPIQVPATPYYCKPCLRRSSSRHLLDIGLRVERPCAAAKKTLDALLQREAQLDVSCTRNSPTNLTVRLQRPSLYRAYLTPSLGAANLENQSNGPLIQAIQDGSDAEVGGAAVEKIKVRNQILENSLRKLESLVRDFKGKVDEIVEEFEELRQDVDELAHQHEALAIDYNMALASVTEEKESVTHYEGLLANANIEIELLTRLVPEDELPLAFSQARPW